MLVYCENCGKKKEVPYPKKRNFCNNKCYLEYRVKNKVGWHGKNAFIIKKTE